MLPGESLERAIFSRDAHLFVASSFSWSVGPICHIGSSRANPAQHWGHRAFAYRAGESIPGAGRPAQRGIAPKLNL